MFLLLNVLSRLVIAFLPRSKCLLISWLQSLSAVILEPPKIKSLTVSIVSPSICHELDMLRRRQWHPTPVLLPGKILWMEEPGGLQSMGSLGVGRLRDFTFTFLHRRRKWQPTPVFLPGESQGWWSLVVCCLWGLTELDTTEAT